MKAIGIEIDKTRAICFALEKDSSGNFVNLTGKFKYLKINDSLDNQEIKDFQSTIHTFFNNINPDRIAIITRQTKGRYASSPISFKIEGLIQCYNNVNIEFFPPQTLTAFYKKNSFSISTQNNYQENAAKLAQFLLK